MESVNKWFAENCPYADGVAIYAGLPRHNPNLLRNFKLKESLTNVEKLKYELSKHRNTPEPVAVPKMKIETAIDARPNNVFANIEVAAADTQKKQALLFSQLPPELRPALLRANELWRKNCYLKVTMNDLPVGAENERLQIQIEIDENQKENQLCWNKIDFWLEHRQLPKTVENDFKDLSPAQLLRRQQLHFQNISKMKVRLDENRLLLAGTEVMAEKSKLHRLVARQESDLLKKEEELNILNRLINGK